MYIFDKNIYFPSKEKILQLIQLFIILKAIVSVSLNE